MNQCIVRFFEALLPSNPYKNLKIELILTMGIHRYYLKRYRTLRKRYDADA